MPILKRGVLLGKEFELYSGGWLPGEKADPGPMVILWFLPGQRIFLMGIGH